MGFFDDLGDTLTGITTFGQCTMGGCGGDHIAYKLGDSISNTFTFGQCNGSGCGQGHTGQWTPLATITGGSGENPTGPLASLGISAADTKTLETYAVIGIGGIIVFNIVLDLVLKII
jgi:hypothetical protein